MTPEEQVKQQILSLLENVVTITVMTYVGLEIGLSPNQLAERIKANVKSDMAADLAKIILDTVMREQKIVAQIKNGIGRQD